MAVATLQINYQAPTPRLLIQLEAGLSFDGNIPFHVYPADPDVVQVTVGDYLGTGKRVQNIQGEIVKFDKTSQAELKYPGVTSASMTSLQGAALRASDLSPVSPRWVLDREEGAIIAEDPETNAPVKIIGGVAVDYSAEYSRYVYTPESSALGPGVQKQYGNIIAIKGESVETLEIDVDIGQDSGFEECYRIVSTVIASNGDETPDRWEKPPGWPDDNTYPISQEGPDPDSSYDDERVHEYGYVNRVGFQRFDRQFHILEKPYTGISSYRPEWVLKKAAVPDGYEKAFNEIDWAKVLAEVGKRWPGVTFG